jgi:hypothetical protein
VAEAVGRLVAELEVEDDGVAVEAEDWLEEADEVGVAVDVGDCVELADRLPADVRLDDPEAEADAVAEADEAPEAEAEGDANDDCVPLGEELPVAVAEGLGELEPVLLSVGSELRRAG